MENTKARFAPVASPTTWLQIRSIQSAISFEGFLVWQAGMHHVPFQRLKEHPSNPRFPTDDLTEIQVPVLLPHEVIDALWRAGEVQVCTSLKTVQNLCSICSSSSPTSNSKAVSV